MESLKSLMLRCASDSSPPGIPVSTVTQRIDCRPEDVRWLLDLGLLGESALRGKRVRITERSAHAIRRLTALRAPENWGPEDTWRSVEEPDDPAAVSLPDLEGIEVPRAVVDPTERFMIFQNRSAKEPPTNEDRAGGGHLSKAAVDQGRTFYGTKAFMSLQALQQSAMSGFERMPTNEPEGKRITRALSCCAGIVLHDFVVEEHPRISERYGPDYRNRMISTVQAVSFTPETTPGEQPTSAHSLVGMPVARFQGLPVQIRTGAELRPSL